MQRMSQENRTARLTILVDPDKKAVFESLCAREDLTPSQVVRRLIRAPEIDQLFIKVRVRRILKRARLRAIATSCRP